LRRSASRPSTVTDSGASEQRNENAFFLDNARIHRNRAKSRLHFGQRFGISMPRQTVQRSDTDLVIVFLEGTRGNCQK
jgi:urease accessory protein UreE